MYIFIYNLNQKINYLIINCKQREQNFKENYMDWQLIFINVFSNSVIKYSSNISSRS